MRIAALALAVVLLLLALTPRRPLRPVDEGWTITAFDANYAIVFECVDRWANAFEGLGAQPSQSGWYQGRSPFVATAFASTISDFSSSISSVMASTRGGKGSSGFGGGGFSGGGGGGGRSW